jgi:hypothetical protein
MQSVTQFVPSAHFRLLGQVPGVWVQEPAPLQLPTGVNVESPVHVCVPHIVVGSACAQTPPMPHWPVLPQTFPGPAAGQPTSAPEVTFEHIPTVPGRLQARQVPLQAALQQTPSTQKPLPQEPVEFGQGCPLTHPVHWPVLVLQPKPFAHWASVAHIVKQAVLVALQVKVPHEAVTPPAHRPAPLQVAAVIWE